MLAYRSPVNLVCSVAADKSLLSVSRVNATARPVESPVAFPRTGHVFASQPPMTLPKSGQPSCEFEQIRHPSILVNLIPTNNWSTLHAAQS
jgi:hypothetical protein